jgi:outer membrane scaffolding protein for murein synthesis (MipA/OmpV family)
MAEKQSQKLEWELGAGLAGFDVPHYVGSSQSKQYLLPVPYVKLKSRYLEIDEGIRGFFFTSPNVRLDISADLGVPVSSDDSDAREGMPDLDTVLQFGPSIEITLLGSRRAESELRLELPVRAAIATDIKNSESIGWIFEPRISYEKRRKNKQGLSYSATMGLRYATREYNAYYYDVEQQFVTPERPFFESGKGYSGVITNLTAGWREGEMIYWGLVRYRNLNNAVFEDSPLVEDKDYYLVGVGVTWMFAQSL